jgi:hypothetical protein
MIWCVLIAAGMAGEPERTAEEPAAAWAVPPADTAPLIPPGPPHASGPPLVDARGVPLPLPPYGALPSPIARRADGLPLPDWRRPLVLRRVALAGGVGVVATVAVVGVVSVWGGATAP